MDWTDVPGYHADPTRDLLAQRLYDELRKTLLNEESNRDAAAELKALCSDATHLPRSGGAQPPAPPRAAPSAPLPATTLDNPGPAPPSPSSTTLLLDVNLSDEDENSPPLLPPPTSDSRPPARTGRPASRLRLSRTPLPDRDTPFSPSGQPPLTAAGAIRIAHDEFIADPHGSVASYLESVQRMGFDPRLFTTPQLMHDIALARVQKPGARRHAATRGPDDIRGTATESENEHDSPCPSPPPAPRDTSPSPLPPRRSSTPPTPAAAEPPRARALVFGRPAP